MSINTALTSKAFNSLGIFMFLLLFNNTSFAAKQYILGGTIVCKNESSIQGLVTSDIEVQTAILKLNVGMGDCAKLELDGNKKAQVEVQKSFKYKK